MEKEKFYIYYLNEDGWIFLKEVIDTLENVLQEVSNYPTDKEYRLEKITDVGNEIINL